MFHSCHEQSVQGWFCQRMQQHNQQYASRWGRPKEVDWDHVKKWKQCTVMQKSYCGNTQPHTQQLPWEASWALLIDFELLGFRNETPVLTQFIYHPGVMGCIASLAFLFTVSPSPGLLERLTAKLWGPRSCRLSHSQKLQGIPKSSDPKCAHKEMLLNG